MDDPEVGRRQLMLALALLACFSGCARWREARHAAPPPPARGSPPVGAPPSAGDFLATRTPGEQPSLLQAGRLIVGDGWGCAGIWGWSESEGRWQCWRAAARDTVPPAEVVAERVGWLRLDAAAGPDRVCATAGDQIRCWPSQMLGPEPPLDVADTAGWDVRLGGRERTKPHFISVGGAFACTSDDGRWSCFGADDAGQLARGGGEAGPIDVSPITASSGATGNWHGCISIDRAGIRPGGLPALPPDDVAAGVIDRGSGGVLCWGRADGGQLGFPGPETCQVAGAAIPCSRHARLAPIDLPEPRALVAGDMFTCAVLIATVDRDLHALTVPPAPPTSNVLCWGGSRDGFFGTAAECPAGLARAWPRLTTAGDRGKLVAAPHAACARAAVPVPDFAVAAPARVLALHAGPRGLCAVLGPGTPGRDTGRVRCAGAIPTPSPPLDATEVGVGQGEQASACAIANHRITCWGGGYSPPDAPARPVVVTMRPRSSQETAVIEDHYRSDPEFGGVEDDELGQPVGVPWGRGCLRHFRCDRQAPLQPVCLPDSAAATWSAIEPHAGALVGSRIHVRGRLIVKVLLGPQGVWGPPGLCNSGWIYRGEIGLDEGPALGLACEGDESRVCCDAHAYGQTVIASGVLFRDTEHGKGWGLRATQLCTVDGPGAASPAAQ
jgi:hypothetical protein